MPTDEPRKGDEPAEPKPAEKADPDELSDDDLQAVSGGMIGNGGTTVPIPPVCFSEQP